MLHLLLAESVLLAGGTVHSMVPGQTPRVADLLVEEGRIAAIGEDLDAPEGAEVLDCTGWHLVPGLFDGWIHHDLEHDPLYVAAGVTTARDLGNDIGRVFLARAPRVRDEAPGPTLLVCGAVLDGAPPATTESVVCTNAAEVEDKLPRLIELGPDLIAIHQGLPAPAWRRTIELAHEAGLQVWGPLPRGVTLEQALEAGQDGFLTLDVLLPAPGGSGSWNDVRAEDLAPAIARLAEAQAALTPLLGAYAVRLEDPGEDPPVLSRLAPSYEHAWKAELAMRRRLFENEEYLETGRRIVEMQERALVELHRRGVTLVPGSGAPNPWLTPGEGLVRELERWAAAGLAPGEVLRLATAGAADALGVGEERGRLAPGLAADILCLGADPEENLSALEDVRGVVLRGRFFSREVLDQLVRRLIEAQDRQRLAAALPIEIAEPQLSEGSPVLAGYAESFALGERFSAERYVVGRLPDGRFVYAARVVTPGGVGSTATVLDLQQTVAPRPEDLASERPVLDEFRLEVKTGGRTVTVEGMRVGGQMRLRRRIDGAPFDNSSTTRLPLLVDAGSVTTALILGQHAGPGPVTTVFFEDLDPAIGQWALEIREGGVFAVGTPVGPMVFTLRPDGGLERMQRVEGNGRVRVLGVETTTFGGPGLPLPPERVGARPAPVEAGAATDEGTDGKPASGGDGAGGGGPEHSGDELPPVKEPRGEDPPGGGSGGPPSEQAAGDGGAVPGAGRPAEGATAVPRTPGGPQQALETAHSRSRLSRSRLSRCG